MASTEAEAVDEPKFLAGLPGANALYDHLTKVLLKIIKASPERALDGFESMSVQVKNESAAVAKAVAGLSDEEKARIVEAATKQLHMIKAPKKVTTGEDGEEEPEEEEEKEAAVIPDIVSNMKALNWAGVYLDLRDDLTYRLALSIQKLATAKDLQAVKFWGVVNGTEKNYFVVESKLEEYPEEEGGGEEGAPSNKEAMGSGANECLYFVTNSPEGEWTKLPAVKPEWIISARSMRRFLTGNLDAVVGGFPRFPWKEVAYLRAQISRITQACTVAPKGVYTVDEEAEPEEQVPAENEEYTGLNPYKGDLLDNWQFTRPGLLKQGRCTPFVAEGEEEEEEDEEEMSEEKKAEKARLEALKEKAFKPLLTLSTAGSEFWRTYVTPSVHDANCYAVATSLSWPGAVTVAQGKTNTFFYTGWGHKQLSDNYSPPTPPPFAPEYNLLEDPKRAPKGDGLTPEELADKATAMLTEESDPQAPAEWVAEEKVGVKDEHDEGDDEDDTAAPAEGDAE